MRVNPGEMWPSARLSRTAWVSSLGVAVAASAAGGVDGVAFAEGYAVGLEAAGLSWGVPWLMTTSGGARAWPPDRPQAGLPERSNQVADVGASDAGCRT